MRPDDVAELAQTLFEEIGDAAFIADPETLELKDVNPMAERLTGWPRSKLLQLPLDQLFRSEGDKGLLQFQRALQTTLTFHSQEGYFLRRASEGVWIPVNLTLTRLHREDGLLGLVLARDVTERIQAEEQLKLANANLERRVQERTQELARVNETLREQIAKHRLAAGALRDSEELFRVAFEQTAVAMVLTDIQNRFVRINAAFARLFGYTIPEMLGMTLEDVTHPSHLKESYDRREVLLSGASEFFQMEKQYLHRDGHTFWGLTSVSLVRNPEGQPTLYVGQVQDITERKRSEMQLHRAQRRLAHVVESSPAVLFTLAIEGDKILGCDWISDNVETIFGYTPEQARCEDWWNTYVHPEDRRAVVAQTKDQLLRQGHTAYEYRFRHADGTYRWTSQEIRLVRDSDGAPVEAIGSWSDITERRKLEEQFRQSQKMEAVGRLAGGVAHDFNNLLTIINGYGALLLSAMPADDPNREMVREIVGAGERATGLTRQLLAFSRKAVIEPKIIDLRTVVSDVDRMLRRIVGEDIQLSVITDPEAGLVRADPGQMEQVLLNLVVNARDAMPRGGKLTVEVRNIELDESYSRTRTDARPGPHLLLAVTDTGCGMDQKTVARVFEPFFTTKGEYGTGLGLATVHGIVRQSGGHVGVYSELGRGTTFKIYLPQVDSEAVPAQSRSGSAVMPTGFETILLVEDEDAVRALTSRVLRSCGYKVMEAYDGSEAVRIAQQHPARIDLLLTDVVLPRMGGREVAENLSRLHPETKILYLSGYTDDAVVRHGILESNVLFLQKPFTPNALAKKVRDVLDS